MASLADNVARVIKVFGDIKTAIIERGVSVENNTPVEEYPDKIDQVFGFGREVGYEEGYNSGVDFGYEHGVQQGIQQGRQAQYDEFWDNYQQNGARTQYDDGFAGIGWTADTFKPKYDITVVNGYRFMSQNNIQGDLVELLNSLGVTLDFSRCIGLQYGFGGNNITRIGVCDFRTLHNNNPTAFQSQIFFGITSLVTIDKLIVDQSPTATIPAYDFTFSGATALKNITFEGTIAQKISFYSCPLTPRSMISIIKCLYKYSDTEYENLHTLTFNNRCWTALETYNTPADEGIEYDGTWKNYVQSLGWLV